MKKMHNLLLHDEDPRNTERCKYLFWTYSWKYGARKSTVIGQMGLYFLMRLLKCKFWPWNMHFITHFWFTRRVVNGYSKSERVQSSYGSRNTCNKIVKILNFSTLLNKKIHINFWVTMGRLYKLNILYKRFAEYKKV